VKITEKQFFSFIKMISFLFSQSRNIEMSAKKMTISDGLCAVAFGTTVATGIIAGVELERPQDQASQEDREVRSMSIERLVSYSRCKQIMASFRVQACWAKMTSPVACTINIF
jgi:hypothetical protein